MEEDVEYTRYRLVKLKDRALEQDARYDALLEEDLGEYIGLDEFGNEVWEVSTPEPEKVEALFLDDVNVVGFERIG